MQGMEKKFDTCMREKNEWSNAMFDVEWAACVKEINPAVSDRDACVARVAYLTDELVRADGHLAVGGCAGQGRQGVRARPSAGEAAAPGEC